MGLDCKVVVFPEGQEIERKTLDRYWVFRGMMESDVPIKAKDLVRKIELNSLRGYEEDQEYVTHWHSEAFDFLKKAIEKHGPDVLSGVYSEDTDPDEVKEQFSCGT